LVLAVVPLAVPSSSAAAAALATMLATSLWQKHYLGANRLRDGVEFSPAHFGFEEFKVAALNANHSKAGSPRSFPHMATLANEYFSHS
jgi:hypothetical protein